MTDQNTSKSQCGEQPKSGQVQKPGNQQVALGQPCHNDPHKKAQPEPGKHDQGQKKQL